MTRRLLPGARGGLLLEYAAMLGVLASFVWVVAFFVHQSYLPQPFIFNTFDTFMDWFNTAYWANRGGAYDVWHTVYPPLSFVFLDLFSLPSCYVDAGAARDCDWLGVGTILLFYVLSSVLACATLWRADRATAVPRGVAFVLGFPLLFCLERGNLIIVCLVPFILAYGNLVTSPLWRGLSIALTINFKPYLVMPSLALGVKRKWRALEAAALLTAAAYLVTLAWVGAGSPMAIAENTRLWVAFNAANFYDQSYFSTSFATLLLIETSPFPILTYVPSDTVDLVVWLIPLVIAASQLTALAGVAAAWLQPQAVPLPRIAALLTAAHFVTQSPGGYVLTFLVFLVFLEPSRRLGPAIALACCYVLSLSYDWILATVIDTDFLSWLSGEAVPVKFGLSIGQFVRPAMVIVILWSLSLDTIAQVIRAHRDRRPSLGLMPA